jgi:hypothetical protein
MIAYKFLREDGSGVFSGFRWPLPGAGPGEWVDAQVDPCRSGIHACRAADLPFWAGRALFEVELEGEILVERRKVISPRGRLLRRIEAWDGLRDVYTRMCADRGHELAQSAAPRLDDWEAVIEPSIPEGPALLGFVAARIAEEISGEAAYGAERDRQAAWLVERLDLQA